MDVFYVLSGFLITSLLLGELDRRQSISLRSFYARRALRLFPGLAVLLVVITIASLVWPDRSWSHLTLIGLPWVVFYAGNWYVVLYGGGAPLGAIGQCWSLGIEEQFYLVWPVILVALAKRFTNRVRVAQGLLVVAGVEVVYRFVAIGWLGWSARGRVYFGTDTHADGLMLGCALAFYLSSASGQKLSERALRVIAAGAAAATVGLVVCLLRFSYVNSASVWLGVPLACVCTSLIVANLVTRPLPVLSLLLGCRPAVWAGKRSYGLYLWQATITMMLSGIDFGISYNKVAGLEVIATFGIAALSYRFVEAPFLRRKREYERTALVVEAG